MIVMISPTKNMREVKEEYQNLTLPTFIESSKELIESLKEYSINDLQRTMKINEKLAHLNKTRYETMKFDEYGTPAILTYDGLQYKNIGATSFTNEEISYVKKHIRILSGLYGVLNPYDSIYPYRLEMQMKLKIRDYKDLYEYWNHRLYEQLTYHNNIIINLASNEYSKAIEKYVTDSVKYITITFKVEKKGNFKVEATASKMARGQMIQYMVKHQITKPEQLKEFHEGGYEYSKKLSNDHEMVFVKSVSA